MLKKIDFKIIGYKELLISIIWVIAVFLFFIVGKAFIHAGEVLLWVDVVLPIALAIPSILIFNFHMSSEMTNILKVYGSKKYNQYILKLVLQYILATTIIFIIFSSIMILLSNNYGIYYEWKGQDIREFSKVIILFKAYINMLFLIIATLFILKISKSNIFTVFTLGIYLFQEIAGEGSYTEPFNLFITYEQRSMYEIGTIFFNRCFFIVIIVLMLNYILRKNN